jgi:OOP family OmpA-OmpF porin
MESRVMVRIPALLVGLILSGAATAQPVSGPYVAGAGGINLRAPQSMTIEPPKPAPTQSQTEAAPVPNLGATASGSAGYGFGNGWRMEVEGSRRR